MTRYSAMIFMVLLAAAQMSALAESKPLELRWSELDPVITGHRVEVLLTEGSTIKGEVIAVREDSLLIDSRNESRASVPRNSINLLKLDKQRGAWGRGMARRLECSPVFLWAGILRPLTPIRGAQPSPSSYQ